MSLLETVISLAILLIVSAGIMSVVAVAMKTTETQGHLQARSAEYAQDKMEQLISLAYGDSTSDTTVFPAANSGGTGLSVGGSSDPSSPVTGYVDYLDASGNLSSAGAAWYYIRVWKIENPTANLKRITVAAQVRSVPGNSGSLPTATVVSSRTTCPSGVNYNCAF